MAKDDLVTKLQDRGARRSLPAGVRGRSSQPATSRGRLSLPVKLVPVSVRRPSAVGRTRRDRDRDVNDNDRTEPDAETPVEVDMPDIVWDEDSATDIVQLPGIPVVREVGPL